MAKPIFFLYSGIIYMLLELIWRNKTHLAMGVAGGLCSVILLGINLKYSLPPISVFFISSLLISAVEMLFGYIFNIRLNLAIWDYTAQRFNLYGQVCLRYSLVWGMLGFIPWFIAKSCFLLFQ